MKTILLALLFLFSSARCAEYLILGRDNSWIPSDLTIHVGDTVHWRWIGLHNVAQVHSAFENLFSGRGFRSGPLELNGEFSWTFNTPGVWYFIDEANVKEGMRGRIIVRELGVSGSILATHGLSGKNFEESSKFGEEHLMKGGQAEVGKEVQGKGAALLSGPSKEIKVTHAEAAIGKEVGKGMEKAAVVSKAPEAVVSKAPEAVVGKEMASKVGQAVVGKEKAEVVSKAPEANIQITVPRAEGLKQKMIPRWTNKQAEEEFIRQQQGQGQAVLPSKQEVGQIVYTNKEVSQKQFPRWTNKQAEEEFIKGQQQGQGQAVLPTLSYQKQFPRWTNKQAEEEFIKGQQQGQGQAVLPTLSHQKQFPRWTNKQAEEEFIKGQQQGQGQEVLPSQLPAQKQIPRWTNKQAEEEFIKGQQQGQGQAMLTKGAQEMGQKFPRGVKGLSQFTQGQGQAEVGKQIFPTMATHAAVVQGKGEALFTQGQGQQKILPTLETHAEIQGQGQAILPTIGKGEALFTQGQGQQKILPTLQTHAEIQGQGQAILQGKGEAQFTQGQGQAILPTQGKGEALFTQGQGKGEALFTQGQGQEIKAAPAVLPKKEMKAPEVLPKQEIKAAPEVLPKKEMKAPEVVQVLPKKELKGEQVAQQGQVQGKGIQGQEQGKEIQGQEKGKELQGQEKGKELQGQEKGKELQGQEQGKELQGQEKGKELQGQEKGKEIQGQMKGKELQEQGKKVLITKAAEKIMPVVEQELEYHEPMVEHYFVPHDRGYGEADLRIRYLEDDGYDMEDIEDDDDGYYRYGRRFYQKY